MYPVAWSMFVFLVMHTTHGMVSEHVWGDHYCDWGSIPDGYMCNQRHNFSCLDLPSFVPCLRIHFRVHTVTHDAPFSLSCRIGNYDHVLCPHGMHNGSEPCTANFSFTPDRHADRNITCTLAANTTTCYRWTEARFDFCHLPYHDPYVSAETAASRGRQRFRPVDVDTVETLQDDIRAHPEQFGKYTPHTQHPLMYPQGHKTMRPLVTTRSRRVQTQALPPDHPSLADPYPNELPSFSFDAHDWMTLPASQLVHNAPHPTLPATTVHVHSHPRFDSSHMSEHQLPGHTYIRSYDETVVAQKHPHPNGRHYYENFERMDTYNLVHPSNIVHHPSTFHERNTLDRTIEEYREKRLLEDIQVRLPPQPSNAI